MCSNSLSISSEPSLGRRRKDCKWSGNMGETSWGPGISSVVVGTTKLGPAHPCPAILLSFRTFLSPWFSVTFLLTSNRNLAPVMTSLRAIGWIGSWKIRNNWSSFHKVHGLNGNYSEGTGGNKYSYSVFLSVFLSFVVFLYLVWWGFVSLRKLFFLNCSQYLYYPELMITCRAEGMNGMGCIISSEYFQSFSESSILFSC